MDPTGTKNYKGQDIRYLGEGLSTQIFSEDFLKVVPDAASELDGIEHFVIDIAVAIPLANRFDEEFALWIKETFRPA